MDNAVMTKEFLDTYFSEFNLICADLGLSNVNIGIGDALPPRRLSCSDCIPIRQPRQGYVLVFNWTLIMHESDLRFGLLEAAFWLMSIWQVEKGPYRRKVKRGITTEDERWAIYVESNEYAVEVVQRIFDDLFEPNELDAWIQQRLPRELAMTA